MKTLKEMGNGTCSSQSGGTLCPGTGPGVSPGRAVDLKMKNYQQLRYLQQLYEDNILNEDEYTEQKISILAALRNLDEIKLKNLNRRKITYIKHLKYSYYNTDSCTKTKHIFHSYKSNPDSHQESPVGNSVVAELHNHLCKLFFD